jgi:hypothetical protein
MNSSVSSNIFPSENNSFTFIAKSFTKSKGDHETPVFFGNDRPKMASFGWKKIGDRKQTSSQTIQQRSMSHSQTSSPRFLAPANIHRRLKASNHFNNNVSTYNILNGSEIKSPRQNSFSKDYIKQEYLAGGKSETRKGRKQPTFNKRQQQTNSSSNILFFARSPHA